MGMGRVKFHPYKRREGVNKITAMLRGGGGHRFKGVKCGTLSFFCHTAKRFQPFKGCMWERYGGGEGVNSFRPTDFQFCNPPPPLYL